MFKMRRFAFTALAAIGFSALSFGADVSLSLDHEYWSLNPGGSVTIFGAITAKNGLYVTNASVEFAKNASGTLSNTALAPGLISYVNAHQSVNYVGALFTVNVPLGATPGNYDLSNNSGGLDPVRSELYVTAWDASVYGANYGIDVQAVPEPTSFVAVGMGCLALIKRRRRIG
jgi:hypothetical protein